MGLSHYPRARKQLFLVRETDNCCCSQLPLRNWDLRSTNPFGFTYKHMRLATTPACHVLLLVLASNSFCHMLPLLNILKNAVLSSEVAATGEGSQRKAGLEGGKRTSGTTSLILEFFLRSKTNQRCATSSDAAQLLSAPLPQHSWVTGTARAVLGLLLLVPPWTAPSACSVRVGVPGHTHRLLSHISPWAVGGFAVCTALQHQLEIPTRPITSVYWFFSVAWGEKSSCKGQEASVPVYLAISTGE